MKFTDLQQFYGSNALFSDRAIRILSMPLRHELFQDPQFGGAGIARSWIEKAIYMRQHAHDYRNRYEFQFDRFSTLWMAFNAWGMCVTLAESDASMITLLGEDREVGEVFRYIVENTDIAEQFSRIERNFPLPSFTDLLRLDPNHDWRGRRDNEYWAKIASAPRGKRVRMSPALNSENLVCVDVFRCMYKVRCNLLHGGKMANEEEARFVEVFSDLLEHLLTGPRNVVMLG